MFQMFTWPHYGALLAALLAAFAIIRFREGLRKEKADKWFRLGLAAVLLACEVSLQLSFVREGTWGVESLPLQLCSLTLLLSAAMLALQWKRAYPIVFFLGLLGALQALLTPNLDQPFPHFRYFHFFIAHIGIIAASLYVYAVQKYRPGLREAAVAFGWLHMLALPATVVNWTEGTNFMFLARKPATASLLDALAPWPYYLLQLELIAAAMCLLLLGAARLTNAILIRRRRR